MPYVNAVVSEDFYSPVANVSARLENSKPKLFKFAEDPIALICSILRTAKKPDLCEVHQILELIGECSSGPHQHDVDISMDDRALADKIRSHFINTILLRRIKDMHISQFMTNLEEALDIATPINLEHIKMLVKLPSFYDEFLQTEAIFKGRKSLPEDQYGELIIVDEILTLAGTVKRASKHEKEKRFYFATQDNAILSVFVKNSTQTQPLWNYMSKKDKFRITGQAIVSSQPGYDTVFYKLGYEYEITDVNS
jgi:hypothetical protein